MTYETTSNEMIELAFISVHYDLIHPIVKEESVSQPQTTSLYNNVVCSVVIDDENNGNDNCEDTVSDQFTNQSLSPCAVLNTTSDSSSEDEMVQSR